jgi:succinoglycan biosynthesis protein ExoM
MRVAVCIITFRRPEGLRRALDGVAAQVFAGAAPDLRLVVVDNDEQGSAREVCEAARARLPWPVDYVIEPRRGIPFARNRCVEVARPQADWIGFIDDDEEPAPGWLAELLRVQEQYAADVVTGPVVPRFVGEVPDWAVKGGLFNRIRFATGTRRDRAFTNNVLFRAEIFDRVRPHFDERMVMTGGSDAHFSRRVHRAGYKIIWADEAVVEETFPASRVAAAWVYQRAYRIGTTTSFIARDLDPLPVALVTVAGMSLVRLGRGLALAAAGSIAGRHMRVAGLRQICYGAGMVVGLFGGRYEEYRRTHGG